MTTSRDSIVSRGRGRVAIVGLVTAVALPLGCGTRVEPSAATASPSATAVSDDQAATGSVLSAPSPSEERPDHARSTMPSDAVGGSQLQQPTAGGNRLAIGSGSAPSARSGGNLQPEGNAAAQRGQAPTPDPGSATPSGERIRSPVVVASVGSYSGPAGTILYPAVQGLQVWVKHANSRGGVNGHPVKLTVFDDGADPARHRAQVQEAVERHHAVAFLQNGEGITGASSVEYVNAKRVPIIGSSGAETWAYSSPMYFPPAAVGEPLLESFAPSLASQWVPEGRTKLATVVCTETPTCAMAERIIERESKALGFEYVYRGRTSLAQPDFTAECLAARSAGAEAIFILLDQNSVSRLASGCVRQGYRPKFGAPGGVTADRFKVDNNLDGLVSQTPVFPYFQTGTPATNEFQQAMRASRVELNPAPALGWAAGKLFEKAAARLPEPPTSEAVLAGLWGIQGDNLGGLTAPLTFIKNQPPPTQSCWWVMVVRDGAWHSADDFKLHCR